MKQNPSDLITQVARPGEDNNNNATSTQSEIVEVETSEEAEKRTFFQCLCCCFYRKEKHPATGDEYRREATEQANEMGIVIDNTPLLPPPSPDLAGKKCLVLDLDETLVHSSFKPIPNPDFIIPVEIEEQIHKVYVLKRPGVDQFLQKCGEIFEMVVFTASLAKYADPVLDLLDTTRVIHHRLFREACTNYKGNFVKDMSRLGRDVKRVMIIDNSPSSYLFHPENAIPCETWYDDEQDTELLDLIPILEQLASPKVDNIIQFLASIKKPDGRVL